MSLGAHNLFANPSFVGGLHQDPSSSAFIRRNFDPARTATSAFSALSYGEQCLNSLYSDEANCLAAPSTWYKGAPGSITVSRFPDAGANGDQIVFGSAVSSGSYLSSKRTTLTLTAYHAGGSGSQTLTGAFDGPIAIGDEMVEHRTHYPHFVSSPSDTVIHKDKVVTLVAQTSYDADRHSFYNGGVAMRWVNSKNIRHTHPGQIGKNGGGHCSINGTLNTSYINKEDCEAQTNGVWAVDDFGYLFPNNKKMMGDPRIFRTSDLKNGEALGGGTSDTLNVSTPNLKTCILEIGPFGSEFNGAGYHLDNKPSIKGNYWWCELLLLTSTDHAAMVVQSPYFFLEVRD
jgi:hypothetical protein